MSVKGIIGIIVVVFIALLLFGGWIHRFMVQAFTSKAKKEEYIRELMNGVSGKSEGEVLQTRDKLCTPLTAKDLAGKELNYQIIYELYRHRGLDFAVDAVKQASNSESLINSIRENYIRRILSGKPDPCLADIFNKVCTPLTPEDFAGMTLTKENVYSLHYRRDSGLVADVVLHAPNSASLMESILNDISRVCYEYDESDYNHAQAILKAAYHKGFYTEEIGAKKGTVAQWHDDNGNKCAWHEDHDRSITFDL